MNHLAKELFVNIGKYKSALMGLSMLLVFLYHARSEKLGFMPTGLLGTIFEEFNLGVDIFLFLSAFGLCFSLKKNTLKRFYANRFKRVIPTWWVVLLLIHITGVLVGSKFPNGSFVYPHSAIDVFYWYTGLGYFFNTCFYEWYIPTLLFFYLLIPLINRLSRNNVLLTILISIPVILLCKELGYLSHLSLSIIRVPIFLLGVLFFKDSEQENHNQFLITCAILWIYIFALSFFWKVPDVIQNAPLLPVVMGVLGFVFSLKYVKFIEVFFTFFGTVTLEFYLIHPHRRPQYLISYITKNSEMQVLGAFIMCLIASYVLHLLMKKVNERCLFTNHK